MPDFTLDRYGLLDMDGPLADFDKALWVLAYEKGVRVNVDDYDPALQTARYMTDHAHRDERSVLHKEMHAPGWFLNLEPTGGAVEGVDKLLEASTEAGVRIVVCTKPLRRSDTCPSEKLLWLKEHFPNLAKDAVITDDKSLVGGAFLLDDAITPDWINRAMWDPIIFDKPFNREGTVWEDWKRWDWSLPVEELHELYT